MLTGAEDSVNFKSSVTFCVLRTDAPAKGFVPVMVFWATAVRGARGLALARKIIPHLWWRTLLWNLGRASALAGVLVLNLPPRALSFGAVTTTGPGVERASGALILVLANALARVFVQGLKTRSAGLGGRAVAFFGVVIPDLSPGAVNRVFVNAAARRRLPFLSLLAGTFHASPDRVVVRLRGRSVLAPLVSIGLSVGHFLD